jgi:hypothetical protein
MLACTLLGSQCRIVCELKWFNLTEWLPELNVACMLLLWGSGELVCLKKQWYITLEISV